MIRAVLGGSFDPVHDGHVAMAGRVLDDGLADHIHVVPAGQAPLKGAPGASAEDRLAMVELAFARRRHITIDQYELRGATPSYTIDTMRHLVGEYPDDSWRLIIGGDQLGQFENWRDAAALAALTPLIVLARGQGDTVVPTWSAPGQVALIEDFDEPVSSTEIRAMLAAGRLPQRGLAPAVAAHIRRRGLYGLDGIPFEREV